MEGIEWGGGGGRRRWSWKKGGGGMMNMVSFIQGWLIQIKVISSTLNHVITSGAKPFGKGVEGIEGGGGLEMG